MNEQNTVIRLPLWQSCLDEMREQGLTYGSSWKAEFFETRLHHKRNDQQFSFEMLSMRQALEEEDGYYLQSSENGAIWEIPQAVGHEEVARHFDQKLRRYAVRSINIRSATLINPKAELSDEERKKIERNLEKASVRLILISRQKSVVNALGKHAPKLLEKAA